MPTKEQLLNEYLLAAMDSGKVRMKSPKAGRGGEALMTAAENVLPFVSAAKSALEGDYRNAMIQAGLDVAMPPAVKGAAALSGKFLAPVLAGIINNKEVRRLPLESYGEFSKSFRPLPSGELYRETNASGLKELASGNYPYGAPNTFFAEVPEMALGQGNNKGVMFKIQSEGMSGRPYLGKPNLEQMFLKNAGEFELKEQPSKILKAIDEMWISPDAYKDMRRSEKMFFDNYIKTLENQGIKVNRVDELPNKVNDEQLKAKGGKVETNAFPYGLRHDSELPKGKGYFGPMTTSSGDVMTEYSSSDDAGDYPLVVPTLTADEIRTLLSNGELTEQMLEKAQGWADARRKMGKSPFAGSDELRLPIPKKEGGTIGKNVGRGMAGLTRSKQDVNPKDVQAMFLELAASQGMPFAEAGAEYLRGNLEDAKSSAAIDAVLSALPVAGVAAKPVARAVKRAAPVTKELLHDAFNAAQEAGLIQGPAYAIKAYHGSPYKFDKLDMSKIGTGEGNQAFGHGLYTAEAKDVGKEYAEKVRAAPVNIAVATKLHGKNPKTILEQMYPNRDEGWYKNVIKMAESGEPLKESGYLYELNLRWPDAAREAADPLSPHHFLDYDKPLSEQSKFVQDALQSSKSKQLRAIVDYASSPYSTPGLENEVKTMGEAIKLLGMNASPAKGSSLLAKQGIPGIRYLDAGSRSSGGTSNYVLFSDELAEILKRNDEQLKAIGGKKFEYPEAKSSVSGLRVGEQIKNTSSIPATFSNYEIDKGIRSVPMSAFETTNPQDLFYAKNDLERVNNLAEQIKNNGYIDPLIVAVDESGPYVLEGAHRLGALHTLGVEDIPAMVVRDLGD